MKDVARVAGVSHQTVSRVLNDLPGVRPETRRRVREAIEQLGYRPNLMARALATGRSSTLGLVTVDTTLFGPVAALYGIERAATNAGYTLSVLSLRSLDIGTVRAAVQRLYRQSVAGIVLIAPFGAAHAAVEDLPEELPVVVVSGGMADGAAAVAVDQSTGAQLATEHLLRLGHRTVFHLAGPEDWLEASQRAAGWEATLRRFRVAVPPIVRGDWSARSGYEVGRQLLAGAEVSAIFVANDEMALGLLRALREEGRDVPADVSVVGFDDIPDAAYYAPPLTTVHQDFGAVGEECLDIIVDSLRTGTRQSERIVVPPRLVVRESTGPAPVAAVPGNAATGRATKGAAR